MSYCEDELRLAIEADKELLEQERIENQFKAAEARFSLITTILLDIGVCVDDAEYDCEDKSVSVCGNKFFMRAIVSKRFDSMQEAESYCSGDDFADYSGSYRRFAVFQWALYQKNDVRPHLCPLISRISDIRLKDEQTDEVEVPKKKSFWAKFKAAVAIQ